MQSMAANDHTPETYHHWAEQLCADFLPPDWERVASSAYSQVACNRALRLYCKVYLPRSPVQLLQARLRGGRAGRVQRATEELLYYGFSAPEPLYQGRLSRGVEYLFMTAAPGKTITAWLQELQQQGGRNYAQRRALIRALGKHIGRLHTTGFIHGNLHADHIVADQRENAFYFTLVDNEYTLRQSPPEGRRILRNLQQLNSLPTHLLSATDRMRFFTAWHSQMRHLSQTEARLFAEQSLSGKGVK